MYEGKPEFPGGRGGGWKTKTFRGGRNCTYTETCMIITFHVQIPWKLPTGKNGENQLDGAKIMHAVYNNVHTLWWHQYDRLSDQFNLFNYSIFIVLVSPGVLSVLIYKGDPGAHTIHTNNIQYRSELSEPKSRV